MSLGLIATACAAVRASSLGTTVTDLSYDYCIAAIWANTELHLGIIAANLVVGKAVVGFVREWLGMDGKENYGYGDDGYGNKYGSRQGSGQVSSGFREYGHTASYTPGMAGKEDNRYNDFGYAHKSDARVDGSRFARVIAAASAGRKKSIDAPGSDDSQVELAGGITKTTEVHVVERPHIAGDEPDGYGLWNGTHAIGVADGGGEVVEERYGSRDGVLRDVKR